MLIMARHKFVLVHNPKTAGMSLIRALTGGNHPPNPLSHLHAAVIVDRIFQETWPSIQSVCFVRHPLDRYHSLYRFQASVTYAVLSHNSYSHQIARRFSFAEWLEYNLGTEAKATWFGVPQTAWWNGVRHVYKYEECGAAFEAIGKMVGRRLQVPRINVSAAGDDEAHFSNQAREAIWKLERETIDAFGYTV